MPIIIVDGEIVDKASTATYDFLNTFTEALSFLPVWVYILWIVVIFLRVGLFIYDYFHKEDGDNK